MRELSLTFREAMHAQQTGLVPIFLLTITHFSMPEPIRISSDPTVRLSEVPLMYGTVSNGEEYIFIPFSLVLADEKDEAPPTQTLRLANIDRDIMATITELVRSVQTPAQVRCDLVTSANVDFIEVAGATFDLTTVTYAAGAMDIMLNIESLAVEPYPYGSFNPAQFRGLF